MNCEINYSESHSQVEILIALITHRLHAIQVNPMRNEMTMYFFCEKEVREIANETKLQSSKYASKNSRICSRPMGDLRDRKGIMKFATINLRICYLFDNSKFATKNSRDFGETSSHKVDERFGKIAINLSAQWHFIWKIRCEIISNVRDNLFASATMNSKRSTRDAIFLRSRVGHVGLLARATWRSPPLRCAAWRGRLRRMIPELPLAHVAWPAQVQADENDANQRLMKAAMFRLALRRVNKSITPPPVRRVVLVISLRDAWFTGRTIFHAWSRERKTNTKWKEVSDENHASATIIMLVKNTAISFFRSN